MRLLVFIISALLLTTCKKENAPDCFQSAGERVTENLDIATHIHTVVLHDNIKLLIENLETENEIFLITGAEYLLNDIEVKEENGVLSLSNSNTCNWVREYDNFVVKMWTNSVTSVVNYGTEGLETEDYSVSNFTFNQWQSLADNFIQVNSDTLEVNVHTDSGFAALSGTSQFSRLYVNGTSRIVSSNFQTENAIVNNSGKNDILVSVTGSLTAYIEDEGNIYFNDSSIELNENYNGSGEISFLDF